MEAERHKSLARIFVTLAVLLLIPSHAQAWEVEADGTGNRIEITLMATTAAVMIVDLTVEASMPAFVTSATTIAVPPYVMPGGLDVAVVEFDVLPVAVGTQGTGIVTVTGTAAGVPVEETISIPLEVVAEAPSSQGSALPSLPALHNFMQLGLALLLFGAGAIWLRTNPLQARER